VEETTSPSDEGQAVPCPECGSTKGYSRVGKFRSQCRGCNGLLKNEEVGMEIPDEETPR
jgi:uncharacterized protein (DUF983 family)